MRVFVTGATGLVGSLLIERLRARGDQVLALSRGAPTHGSAGVEWVRGDPTQSGPWQERAAECDAVVHLAGESIAARRWSAQQKERLRSSRIEGTRRVVEAVTRTPGRRLICASGAGYYGPRGEESLDETAAPGSDFLAQLCRDWEAEALAARAHGTGVALLRFGVVLSTRSGALVKMLPAFRLFLGGPLGPPERWFPWIHEDDAAGLALLAVDGGIEGPVNAVAPEAVRMAEFAAAIGAALGRPARLRAPLFALRLAVGEMADVVSPGQRLVPRAALEANYHFEQPSLRPALQALLGDSHG